MRKYMADTGRHVSGLYGGHFDRPQNPFRESQKHRGVGGSDAPPRFPL